MPRVLHLRRVPHDCRRLLRGLLLEPVLLRISNSPFSSSSSNLSLPRPLPAQEHADRGRPARVSRVGRGSSGPDSEADVRPRRDPSNTPLDLWGLHRGRHPHLLEGILVN